MQKAFTLIETLVAVAIFALAMGIASSLIITLYRAYYFSDQQSQAIHEAQKGIQTMIQEIRQAKQGDNGAYAIEKADDREFIFYSDIDKDGQTEKTRYFLGNLASGSQTKECVTFNDGGSCSVTFSDFLQGDIISAQVSVSTEGDFNWNNLEYAEISVDGQALGDICRTGCSECAYEWEGTETFDITAQAIDNNLQFLANSTWRVNDFCDWQEPNHSMKANFELSWNSNLGIGQTELKKGVIDPIGTPAVYPAEQEQITSLSKYLNNPPPIFQYFDQQGSQIQETPARLKDTKMMQVYLVIDVDVSRDPLPFELKSLIQLRNLR